MDAARERQQQNRPPETAPAEAAPESLPAALATGPLTPQSVLALQRAAGNTAVTAMAEASEQEADAPGPEAGAEPGNEGGPAGPGAADRVVEAAASGASQEALVAADNGARGPDALVAPDEGTRGAGENEGGAAENEGRAAENEAGAAGPGGVAAAANGARGATGTEGGAAGPGAPASGARGAVGPEGAAPGGARGPAAADGAGPGAAAANGAGPAAPAEGGGRVEPRQDPRFQAMEARTKGAGANSKAHAPPKAGAAAAQAAAEPPGNEVASQAAAAQVDEMGEQKPGVFDRKAFIDAVKKAIEAAAPKNLEEATEFADSGKAGKVKDEVSGQVKQGKEGAEKDIKTATKAPPDTSKAQPKQVTPLPAEEPGRPPESVKAGEAMPPPRPAQETDLSGGPAEVDAKMADAEVTEEQLAKSNEPDFTGALEARKEAKTHSEEAPAGYRKQEQDVLAKSKEEAEATAAPQLAGMHGTRVQAFAKALTHKQDAKGVDEQKRAKVATDIEGIYNRTKSDVTAILDGLDGKVDGVFNKGEQAARTQFEKYVGDRMDAYKEKRYSGIRGKFRWAKDKLFGMPDEVNAFYQEGKTAYLAAMDQVIGQVADVVGTELNAARDRIATGRAEVKKYVAQLPEDLRKVGQDAERNLQDRFDQLSQDVDSKQDELVDAVAQKYVQASNALDERIEELKAANRGLVDKAIDAIAGVIKTILQLKDLLLSVLSKAAGVIGDIISDPIGFLGRLVDGIKSGLSNFLSRIGTHLQNAMLNWLFGALGSAGITMPAKLDLAGIFDLVMQVIGLTYANIRARVARIVGEPAVARMEQTVDLFKTLATKGIAGLWELVKDQVGNLEDLVIGQIKEFLVEKVIKAGITWIMALMNPAGAFIRACKAIYDIVMWVVERGAQLMEFVNSVLDSIADIAKGNIGVVASKVEDALARALPLAISFLASLIGLGGISDRIRSIIDTVRKPINKAIDSVVMKAVKGFKKLFGKPLGWAKDKYERGKKWAKDKVEGAKEWGRGKIEGAKERLTGGAPDRRDGASEPAAEHKEEEKQPDLHYQETVVMHGERHTLEADEKGSVTLASVKGGIVTKALSRWNELNKHTPKPEAQMAALQEIIDLARKVQAAAKKAKRNLDDDAWRQACNQLRDAISAYGQQYDQTEIDPPEDEGDIEAEVAKATHVKPADYSGAKHWRGNSDDERKENSKNNAQFMFSMTPERVAELEKETLLTGELVPRGNGAYHAFKTFPFQVGWDQGKPAFLLRAELSAGSIHSHPRLSR
jgi:hypothetical protein